MTRLILLGLHLFTFACVGPAPLPNEAPPEVMQREAPLEALPDPLNPPPVIGDRASTCDVFGAVTDDRDSDGLPDSLEQALARHFFPDLHQGWESQKQFYGLSTDSWGRATICRGNPNCKLPFLARKVGPLQGQRAGWCAQGQCVELSFGLPYNWDMGDMTVGDPVASASYGGFLGVGQHRGDAEFVSLIVAFTRADDEADGTSWGAGVTFEQARDDVSLWRVVGKFYAAHLCAATGDSSRFRFPGEGVLPGVLPGDGRYFELTRTQVWVSNAKNGSYPSRGACDEGAHGQDDCDGGAWLNRDALLPKLTNIGESYGGVAVGNHGSVCRGFDTALAKPEHPFRTPSSTLDVWGDVNFDTTTSMYNLFHRAELDWGNGVYYCW